MKKTYISPDTKAFDVKAQSILAGSVTSNNAMGNGTQLSKESGWDDDGDCWSD